jgi:hypothetical protein
MIELIFPDTEDADVPIVIGKAKLPKALLNCAVKIFPGLRVSNVVKCT